jgi:hypothetical protein
MLSIFRLTTSIDIFYCNITNLKYDLILLKVLLNITNLRYYKLTKNNLQYYKLKIL